MNDARPAEGVDPVTGATFFPAANREPAFVVPGRDEAAAAKMRAFRDRTGRRPNVVVILMDDVGWGDFGCYGGGVAVGAPTPNVDRLAREGLLLTSCYSEPSCTPTRASIMTGRLPMRHGLLVPPMYGMPGGLSGEVTLPQLLSDAGYVTQAVGKWHMGENAREPTPECRLRRFLRLPLGVGHVHRVARPLLLPRGRLQRGADRVGPEHPVQQVLRPCRHATGRSKRSRRSPFPCSPCSTTSGARYSEQFIERMAGADAPWFLYHCTRGAHFDNYPHPDFLGRSPARHPYKDAIVELDAICGRLVAALERTGQLESTMVVISSDNGPEMETWPDSAFTPFRCAKGSTWEGGVRVPAVRDVARHDRARSGQRRPGAPARPLRHVPVHGRTRPTAFRPIATSTPSTSSRSCSRPTIGRRCRTASSSTTGSLAPTPPCGSASTST